MSISQLSLAIVGADFQNKRGPSRRFELALCVPGEPVELRPEPNNPADEYAVAVYSARGIQIGYLSAERAPWIGGMIKQGREIGAVFQQQTHFGAWARVAFDGAHPELPPIRQEPQVAPLDDARDPLPDFYPDEEWPD